MRNYSFYLDKAREMNGYNSDKQIDYALNFKGSVTCQLRKNKLNLSDEKMIELAKLGGINPIVALIDLNIMRTTGESRKAYERMYSGLSKSLTTLCLITAFLLTISAPAQAKVNTDVIKHNIPHNMHYHTTVMLKKRWKALKKCFLHTFVLHFSNSFMYKAHN